MTNKEKFLNLVSTEKTNTLEKIIERKRNRAMLRESQNIALKVLVRLDELKWTQKKLAQKLEVAPQQITKIVKGQENLTLETLIKLQTILNIPILASYFDPKEEKSISEVAITTTEKYIAPKIQFNQEDKILLPKKEFKMEYNVVSEKYNYFELTA